MATKQWLRSTFRQKTSAPNLTRLAVARCTGTAGFPAGSAPSRLDAASAASGLVRGEMRGPPSRRRIMGDSHGSSAADRAPGASSPRRAKPAESRRSQFVSALRPGRFSADSSGSVHHFSRFLMHKPLARDRRGLLGQQLEMRGRHARRPCVSQARRRYSSKHSDRKASTSRTVYLPLPLGPSSAGDGSRRDAPRSPRGFCLRHR